MNTVDAASAMPEADCVTLSNMIVSQLGIRVRSGYQQYTKGIAGVGGNKEVRSIFPFNGSNSAGTQDKLFAAAIEGIYGASPSSQAPTLVATYGTQTGLSGYGTCVAFNTSADRYLVVTDEVNGLWVYTQSSDTWAAVTQGAGGTQISGVNPASFAHVTVFKNRLWFAQKNSTVAWYLGTNALYGAATSFDFGARFRTGGDLRGLFNWSYDGGGGIDTLLVAISGGGDVVIYQGTDPTTAASFSLKGTWFVGGVPAGRRIATEHGGDLLILGHLGVIPLSRLVTGRSESDLSQYSTFKIGSLFNSYMSNFRNAAGWAIWIHTQDNVLLINVPSAGIQFAMSLANGSWSTYGSTTLFGDATFAGLPILSGAPWNGTFYMGMTSGGVVSRVPVSTYVDNLDIGGTYGISDTQIPFSVITRCSNLGSPRLKQVQEIRPRFLAATASFPITATAKYDYNLTGAAAPAAATILGTSVSGFAPVIGATGLGSIVAIALRGSTSQLAILAGIDLAYTEGGFQ